MNSYSDRQCCEALDKIAGVAGCHFWKHPDEVVDAVQQIKFSVVRVGVSVIIYDYPEVYPDPIVDTSIALAQKIDPGRRVLIGKRLGSHGAGTYTFPGGHVEYGETFEKACHREVWEETGLRIKNLRLVETVEHVFKEEGRHYVTFFYAAGLDCPASLLETREPEKCAGWIWAHPSELESYRLFAPTRKLVQKTGRL